MARSYDLKVTISCDRCGEEHWSSTIAGRDVLTELTELAGWTLDGWAVVRHSVSRRQPIHSECESRFEDVCPSCLTERELDGLKYLDGLEQDESEIPF